MTYRSKQNGAVKLQSLKFPKNARFFVSEVPDEKQGDWTNQMCTWIYKKKNDNEYLRDEKE